MNWKIKHKRGIYLSKQKNAADSKQIKEDRLKESFEQKQELADIRYVLSDPRGRRYILKYLSAAGFYRNEFSPHADYRAFRDGQRNIAAKMLMDVLEVDPEAYGKMLIEFAREESGHE